MTDIYGANLYNRYLAQQHALTTSSQVVAQGVGSLVKTGDKQLVSSAAQCRSILVGFNETSSTHPQSPSADRLVVQASTGRTLLLESVSYLSSGVYRCL